MIEWILKTKRLCSCPDNNLNCLSGRDWIKSMIGVWEFFYNKEDYKAKKKHPAVFPIDLAKRVILLFTHRGENVLDIFMGTGTTLLASKQLSRNGIGIELNREYCNFAKERVIFQKSILNFTQDDNILKYEIINDDVRNILNYIPKKSIHLVFTSPPYSNLLDKKRENTSYRYRKNERLGINEQYSNDERDFGKLENVSFFKNFTEIAKKVHSILTDKGHFVINMMDVRPDFYALPNLKKALSKANFQLKNIIIWDKRNLVNKIGIYGYPTTFLVLNCCYEYIFDFIKLEDK